jgi:hypothetical protein
MTLTAKKIEKPGTLLDIDCTELHTWFERDRAHVELRNKLDDQTIVEWWDEAVGEAVEDGFLPSKAFIMGKLVNESLLHSAAYEYAKEYEMLPRVKRHYIAGSGSHGCLYDQCSYHEDYNSAVESLAETFELGRTRKARLKKNGYLELVPGIAEDSFGAEYCEVTSCDCGNPLEHQDA